MSKDVNVYQTLRDEGNPGEVERDGPFICEWDNSWLGTGYYFWETFIENAHWWGKVHVRRNYFICEAQCTITDTNCFDLVGNTNHMVDFGDAIDEMTAKSMVKKGVTTVPRIIEFMRKFNESWTYDATRAVGWESVSEAKNKKNIYKMLFEPAKPDKKTHYLNYKPAIQLCLYTKTALGLNNYHLVFPDEYNPDYVL